MAYIIGTHPQTEESHYEPIKAYRYFIPCLYLLYDGTGKGRDNTTTYKRMEQATEQRAYYKEVIYADTYRLTPCT